MLLIFSSSFSIPFSREKVLDLASFLPGCSLQTSNLSCQSKPNQSDSLLPSWLIYLAPNNWLSIPSPSPHDSNVQVST